MSSPGHAPAGTRRAARDRERASARRRSPRDPYRRVKTSGRRRAAPGRSWTSRTGLAVVTLIVLTSFGWGTGRLLGQDVAVTGLAAAPQPQTPSPGGVMAPASDDSTSPAFRTATPTRPITPSASPARSASSAAASSSPSTSVRKAAPRGVRAGEQDLLDVAYASRSETQKLDLYLPARTGTAVPLVILIHGGAFMGGDKADERDLAQQLRDRGYAVACVSYRLSGEARFPAGVQDVKAAVRWLRAHAASHGLHPDRFAAWGSSAGGYLAVMLGVTGDRRTTLDDASLGNARVSSAVQLVVDLYGPGDFLAMDAHAADPGGCSEGAQVHDAADSPESQWLGAPIQSVPDLAARSNPLRHLAAARRLPPFVIAHGKRDCLVPHGQSVQLAAALRKAGARVSLNIVDGAGHSAPEFDGLYGPALTALERLSGRS